MNTARLRGILISVAAFAGCVLFAFAGFLVGGGSGSPANSRESVDWIPLGKPSMPIDHLLYVSPYSIYVRTIDGKIFVREIECISESCWMISDSLNLDNSNWITESLTIGETCDVEGEIKTPPGLISECASLKNLIMAGGYLTVYSVLLDDGTVWLWMHGAYDIDYGLLLISVFTRGLLGACISIVLYILVGSGYILYKRSLKNIKQQ